MQYCPFGQVVPFFGALTVYAESQFCILIFGFFEVARHLLYDPREVLSVQVIVSFEKHFPEPALANWVIFGVEFVKTVECVPVGVHVQHVYCEVVRRQVHRLE